MDEETGVLSIKNVISTLTKNGTAYNEFNIPRMRYLTTECIGEFFRHLASLSPDLVCALLETEDGIPPCEFKLVDKPIEIWAAWSML